MLMRGLRHKQGLLALNYVDHAVRQNLPLPAMLAAAEEAEAGKIRQRLGRLRELIESGTPLSVALAQVFPGISARGIGLIASGERLGRLPQALSRVMRQAQSPQPREPLNSIYLRWYPLAMLLTLTVVGGMLMIFVMPRYLDLFHDFHIPLPAITTNVTSAYKNLMIPAVVVLSIVLAIFCGRMLAEIVRIPGDTFQMWSWLTDRIAWITPVWRGVIRHRCLGDVCQVMADALAIGQPADIALAEASRTCDNVVLRKRIVDWGGNVTRGMNLSESARRAKIPPLVVNLLKTAHGPDAARNVFAFLARYYDSRHSAAIGILNGAAIPLMVGVFGFVVASIALAMFMPLIELMNHLPVTRRLM
jgi:type II secretory pathway component PulF